MSVNWITEFQKAYEDVPSQDNEGYVPDRGGFKMGFGAAWRLKEAELQSLRDENKRLKIEISVYIGTLQYFAVGPIAPSREDYQKQARRVLIEQEALRGSGEK